MKKIIATNYEEMSQLAASIILGEMLKNKRNNISITSGSSPDGVYAILAKWYREYKSDFADTYFYSFDEVENNIDEPITKAALNKQFYHLADVPEANIRRLTYANYQEYDQMIKMDGGLDVMLLGLGADGHFCGNMPFEAKLNEYTYQIPIKKEHAWYKTFEGLYPNGNIPEYFVTMGLKSLMRVRHLVLIVNGTGKAEAVKKLFSLPVSNEFPATGLLQHPNLTIILDQEAATLLE